MKESQRPNPNNNKSRSLAVALCSGGMTHANKLNLNPCHCHFFWQREKFYHRRRPFGRFPGRVTVKEILALRALGFRGGATIFGFTSEP
jgi:hypothetical protein